MSRLDLILPATTTARLNFVVVSDPGRPDDWAMSFQSWLLAGGYAQSSVATTLDDLRQMISTTNPALALDARIEQACVTLEQRTDLSRVMKHRFVLELKKLREFRLFSQGKTRPRPEVGLPRRVAALPAWVREPLSNYVRLRQRNWPPHALPAQTHNLVCQLGQVLSFFLTHYQWQTWAQLSLRWVDAYIDQGLHRGLTSGSLNGALRHLQMFCRFMREEGYEVPLPMTQLKLLNKPQRLPRPLSEDQVHQLEQQLQAVLHSASDESQRRQVMMDLAWFYLMWHCGLRLGEVQRLTIHDLDLPARQLWVRDSKERKDRLVYLSETAVAALQHHLNTRLDQQAEGVFTYHHRCMTTRTLARRLARYGQSIRLSVSPHRLRHTMASQMLNVGMPVTSLQRYLGHENLDTTMGYAAVSDPVLRQDYYRGIAQVDAASTALMPRTMTLFLEVELRRLIAELQTSDLPSARQQMLLEQMQQLLDKSE